MHDPEWMVGYFDSASYGRTPEEIEFVDWVFNASPMLKKCAEVMVLHEGMIYYKRATEMMPPKHIAITGVHQAHQGRTV